MHAGISKLLRYAVPAMFYRGKVVADDGRRYLAVFGGNHFCIDDQ